MQREQEAPLLKLSVPGEGLIECAAAETIYRIGAATAASCPSVVASRGRSASSRSSARDNVL
ncbi:hypothetical protein OR60_01175 [Xanthomonas vesicatoria]|uniref:Uncharacterized protein n=1 Tax=Xanthomonas vesicatoria TaxID=56460 RepID=A0AAJ0IZS2_9XANT|nr:hypothetical protein BI313_22160 [Xanthomonas vesicatoria]KHM96020.1 hypothetical protein OR61_07470 [Xanthomonas vesicatoria]KHM98039.1 hypothetical protein OR60_01175 [Xanthomonas vesicatoria]